jgi:hypothetical protein
VNKTFDREELIRIPEDGYWVLPVGQVDGNPWSRSKSPNPELENWGTQYFAIRTPVIFGSRLVNNTLLLVKRVLDGDISQSGLKAYMKNDKSRSEYDACHVGVIAHYGADDKGSHGLRLSKDTIDQGKFQMDALHLLFLHIQKKISPIINRHLRQMDPPVYQFHQA